MFPNFEFWNAFTLALAVQWTAHFVHEGIYHFI